MGMDFKGFPPDLFAFLADLAAHNDREWFQANRERYERHVVAPVQAFIQAVGERVLPHVSDAFVADPRRQGGSMFRIFRDTRFSGDKRPYKENVGCQFRHAAGRDVHAPGFYVHLAPGEVFLGGGIWKPDAPTLARIRAAIIQRPKAWAAVVDDIAYRDYFDGLEGESLTRPSRGIDPAHPHVQWLKRKSLFALKNLDPARVLRADFLDEAETAFQKAGPLVRFIAEALELHY